MDTEAVQELVQALRDGVAGAEARLSEALPMLAQEMRMQALVGVVTGLIVAGTLLVAAAYLFRLARALWVARKSNPDDLWTIPAGFGVVAMLMFMFAVGPVVYSITQFVAPHLALLKLLRA